MKTVIQKSLFYLFITSKSYEFSKFSIYINQFRQIVEQIKIIVKFNQILSVLCKGITDDIILNSQLLKIINPQ